MSFEIKPALNIEESIATYVNDIVGTAPTNLNTLDEISDAILNSSSFGSDVYTNINNINDSISNLNNYIGSVSNTSYNYYNNNYQSIQSLSNTVTSLSQSALTTASLTNTQLTNPTVNYVESKFVGAKGGTFSFSGDNGSTWTTANSSTSVSNPWKPIQLSDRYLVTGNYGDAAYSTNGTTWTYSGNFQNGTPFWRQAAYGNGTVVVVPGLENWGDIYSSSQGRYSTNGGVTWNTMNLPANKGWTNVVFGNGKFVTASQEGGILAYSSDGINWTQVNILTRRWNNLSFVNGTFFLVAQNGPDSETYYYSTDGANWTQASFPATGRNWYGGVQYGNGKYVAVPDGSYAYYSTDGVSWSSSYTGGYGSMRVSYLNGKFIGLDKDYWGNHLVSTNGTSWSFYSNLFPSSRPIGFAYAFGYWFRSSNDYIHYSSDAVTWNVYSQSSLAGSEIASFDVTLSVSPKQVSYLKNIMSWRTTRTDHNNVAINSIAYNPTNNRYVAVGNSGLALYSTNLSSWSSTSSGFGSNNINTVAYGNGLFVAVGQNGVVSTSSDGISWTVRTSNFGAYTIHSVVFADNKWVAVGASASSFGIITSTDGINWTYRNMSGTTGTTAYSVARGGDGYWVVVGTNSTTSAAYSTDGLNWTAFTLGSSSPHFVFYANSTWYVIASSSLLYKTSIPTSSFTFAANSLPITFNLYAYRFAKVSNNYLYAQYLNTGFSSISKIDVNIGSQNCFMGPVDMYQVPAVPSGLGMYVTQDVDNNTDIIYTVDTGQIYSNF